MDSPLSRIGDHLKDDFLMLSKAAVNQVGQAAQTLGGLYLAVDAKKGQTFASRPIIAEKSCRPVRSLDRDLDKLWEYGWILKLGRKKFDPRIRKVRRTNTLELTEMAYSRRKPFLRLPTWACEFCPTWGERVVFAAIVTRHLMIELLEIELNHGREGYSVKKLSEDTGLTEKSVIEAKRRLIASELIDVDQNDTYRNERGQLHRFSDEIYVNVEKLLPIKSPDCKSGNPVKAPLANGMSTETLTGVKKWQSTPCKSGNRVPVKVDTTPCKSGNRNEQELLKPPIKRIPIDNTLAAQGRCVIKNQEEEKKCEIKKPKVMPTNEEIAERLRNYQAYMRQLELEAEAAFGGITPTTYGNSSCHLPMAENPDATA